LARKQLHRGIHRSTAELETGIIGFIEAHNENPNPYHWTKSAAEILAFIKRFWQRGYFSTTPATSPMTSSCDISIDIPAKTASVPRHDRSGGSRSGGCPDAIGHTITGEWSGSGKPKDGVLI
jgi:hypothetical protein